jgi:hypothetical protein
MATAFSRSSVSEKSLMPEGLEAVIDHQAMSDLIAFLRSAN